ncbi:TPA: hypothetical protein HA361_04780 [Candidatus Woesearchaeota archaeon]|nr:hypothetical protein [Candidatus Woesearchaeota archaeon]HII69226.1 hypothetical protein [Candidatus Woesearchaeota archaeon]
MKDVIVRSHIKRVVSQISPERKLSISEEFYLSLSKEVERVIKRACERARANNRTTLMGRDV